MTEETNRWIGLMDEELLSQLSSSDLKGLEFLESVVSDLEELEKIEVIDEKACVLVRNDQSEITLDILKTHARRLANDHHLAITIGVNGFPEYHREVWIYNAAQLPSISDCCAAFLLLAVQGFPGDSTPQHLRDEIERANRFADDNKDEVGNEDETT